MPSFVAGDRDADISQHRENQVQGASSAPKQNTKASKKEQGLRPALKIVSTLFPRKLDLILIAGLTLLVRARAPPETWTTRLWPCGQPEPALVDHLFRLVTIFGNDCSKLEQPAK
jgi:hypothetical protein